MARDSDITWHASYVTLIEGNSVAAQVVAQVKHLISADERVLVTLDSVHNKAHVLAELESYAPLVSVGSYIVAMDGIMSQVAGAPRTVPDWGWNNPQRGRLRVCRRKPGFRDCRAGILVQ